MQYNSKIIKHSISKLGNDIVTFEWTVPKWLIGEINTHKVEIERNSASSRAVPTNVIIDMIEEYPCIPLWMYNESGMTVQEKLNQEDAAYANKIWLEIRDLIIPKIRELQHLPSGRSVSKGTINRPLEWIMWTKVVITMTGGGGIGINNLFGLRDTIYSQPEFGIVAKMAHNQYHNSVPIKRKWHTPYVDDNFDYVGGEIITPYGTAENEGELEEIRQQMAIISSARCGRVTHYRQGNINPKTGEEYTIDEDVNRGLSFAQNGHFSPLRHASRAGDNKWYGNMYGWEQISKIIMPYDYITKCCERSKT